MRVFRYTSNMPRGTKEPAGAPAQAVAEQIRREMGAQRMSGRALARAIDRGETYVRERISGQRPLDLNDLDDIAQVLGLDVIVLLEKADAMVKQVQPEQNVVRMSDYRTETQRIIVESLQDKHAALHGDDPTHEQESPDTP